MVHWMIIVMCCNLLHEEKEREESVEGEQEDVERDVGAS